MEEKRYYSVKAKCGHVGRYNCIWIDFAVVAKSKKEAISKIRKEGRVKRNHNDFIKAVNEITFEEFIALKAQNDTDAYLHCKNIQEQRQIQEFGLRVVADQHNLNKLKTKNNKRNSVEYRRKKARLREESLINNIFNFYKDGCVA